MMPVMIRPLALLALCSAPLCLAQPANVNWPNVGNDKGGQRCSTLDQINRDNVATLAVAWTYHTKDAADGTTIECTPIVIDGVMYVTTVRTRVAALDAATGRELWSFDPYTVLAPLKGWMRASGGVNRGVAYWQQPPPPDQKPAELARWVPQQRIIVGLTDGRLLSLDAKTGQPDNAFGAKS